MRKTNYQKIKEIKEKIETMAMEFQALENELPKVMSFNIDKTQFVTIYNELSAMAAQLRSAQMILEMKGSNHDDR